MRFATQCTERSIPQGGGEDDDDDHHHHHHDDADVDEDDGDEDDVDDVDDDDDDDDDVCVCVDIACVLYTSSWYVPCVIEGDQPYGGGPPIAERNWHIYSVY